MSVAPAAIDGLLEVLGSGSRLHGVQVLDGPQARWPDKEFIVVGLSPEDPTVPSTRQPAGPMSTTDSVDITCMARSWTGSTEIRPRRLRAYELFAAVVALVEADRTLGGTCSHAEVTGSVYAPSQGTRGVIADVMFVVQARAF